MKLDRDVMALMRATKKAAKPVRESLKRFRRPEEWQNHVGEQMEQQAHDGAPADA